MVTTTPQSLDWVHYAMSLERIEIILEKRTIVLGEPRLAILSAIDRLVDVRRQKDRRETRKGYGERRSRCDQADVEEMVSRWWFGSVAMKRKQRTQLVSRFISELEHFGLIEQRISDVSRRQRTLSLTDGGFAVLGRARSIRSAELERLLATASPADRLAVQSAIEVIASASAQFSAEPD